MRISHNPVFFQAIITLGFVGATFGAAQFGHPGPGFGLGHRAGPHHGAPVHHAAPLHHAPAPYAPPPVHHDPYKIPPRPFAYEFGVQDSYSGADFAKKEVQDEYGVVTGEYRVALPDGRIQIVTYHADHEGGFIADVKYEGVAVYPEPHHAPAPYAPAPYAPAPHHAPLHHAPPHHGLRG